MQTAVVKIGEDLKNALSTSGGPQRMLCFCIFQGLDFMKRRFKQLVGDTELEDCQKRKFYISPGFSSDTCKGIRQNSECRDETSWKARRKRSSF